MRQPIGPTWAPRRSHGARARADRAAGWGRAADPTPRHRSHGRGLSAEQEAILEIQRLAGNRAVARALADGQSSGRVTSVDAIELTRDGMAPPSGVEKLREESGNKIALALTQRGIRNEPPLMKALPPEQVKGGFAARTQKLGAIEEPILHEWWPKQGRHRLDGNSVVDVDRDWEEKLRDGEDQHAADAKLAWELTWKVVRNTINRFADKPGPPEATREAATKALWKRYVAALPNELRPAGDEPDAAKQMDVLAVEPGTFFAWMWEATVSRDSREYHTTFTRPAKDPKNAPKNVVVNGIVPHSNFNVKKPTTEDFIAEMRAKWTPRRINVASKLQKGKSTGKQP